MPDLNQHGGCAPLFAFGCNSQKVGAFLQTLHDELGRKTLATLCATVGNDLATANSGHTGAEAMAALADELARLISALHGTNSDNSVSKTLTATNRAARQRVAGHSGGACITVAGA